MSFFSAISSIFTSSPSSGSGANRSRTLTSTHDAFSLPTHSPGTSYRNDGQFSYPPPAAYSPSPTTYDYMPQATRDNFRRSQQINPKSPIATTWERIRKFLNREYPELGDSLNYGITPAILQQVETELGMSLPRAVRESYMLCDGQEAESGTACAEGLFYGLTLLPLEDVLEEWRFWREVDEDPSTGANPQLLQVMASIPPGWIRKAYSCRGWLPLITDKAGNYLGVDLAPAEEGAFGQVIVFGRDFDTKVVMFRGEGEDGWATWLQTFAEELENGDGYEVGGNDSASEGSDDVGYESYFYDGSGRSKGVGGARDGTAGIKLTGEYKGWNVLEAFADRSYRRWRERDMAPDLDALQNPELPPQNVQLVGPAIGSGSGVEVPIPIMGGSAPSTPTPSISITRAGAPQPLHLPTQADIVPPTAERAFAPDDVEAGMGNGMQREAVPLREMSIDSSTTTADTTDLATPTASKPPVDLGAISLMDAPPSPAPVNTADPLGLAAAALVPVPPPSDEEAAELDESNAPPTTIRLVGAPSIEPKVDSDNDSRASIDSKGKKKRFSKSLSKLGLKKKDEDA